MQYTQKKHKIRNDIILIAAILLIAAIGSTVFILLQKDGTTVIVTVDKELYGKYSVFENKVVEIKSENGTNVLTIKDGEAYISEASCPGFPPEKRCSNQHPISKKGQSIICAPNKVVVSIE